MITPKILIGFLLALPLSLMAVDNPPEPAVVKGAYTLGPGDVVSVAVMEVEETTSISAKPLRIEPDGAIALPLVGRVKAAGLTTHGLEGELITRYKEYVKDPHISVTMIEFGSQPVTVLGAVNSPGVKQTQGRQRLLEVISLAGGVSKDAGSIIKVTRPVASGPLPLDGAKLDPSGQYYVAQIPLDSLIRATNPEANILVERYDVITIPAADMLFVLGAVKKAGAFEIHDGQQLSVLVALSMAEGPVVTAATEHARILRLKPGSSERQEIAVNLKKILHGKDGDVALQRNDILFVPISGGKAAGIRGLEAALQLGTGLAVYR